MTPRKPKPPAFQFYPADFLVGCVGLSLEEVGAYIRLLCVQWETGSVPSDPTELARVVGCDGEKLVLLWRAISGKFSGTKKDGSRFNRRLELERSKQAKFRKSRRENGLLGGRPKTTRFPVANLVQSTSKALRLLSSDLVRTPPYPPSSGGAVEISEKPPTREERRWAKALLREERGCPHEPTCASVYACEGRLIGERRDEERRGLRQGAS